MTLPSAPGGPGAGSGGGGSGGGGLTTLTLNFDVSATVPPIGDFATFQLGDLPNTNMLILGVRLQFTGTKELTAPFLAAVGTAPATSSTITGDKGDIMFQSSSTGNGTTDMNLDRNSMEDSATNGVPKRIVAQSGKFINLNIQHLITGATSDIAIAGTLTIIYVDAGGPEA